MKAGFESKDDSVVISYQIIHSFAHGVLFMIPSSLL